MGMPKFNKELHRSEEIVINGQTYNLRKLYAQSERAKQNINLRTGTIKKLPQRPRAKYSLEDRIWQAESGYQSIMTKYNLNETQARGIHWQAKEILSKLDIDYKNKS